MIEAKIDQSSQSFPKLKTSSNKITCEWQWKEFNNKQSLY